MGFVGGTYYHVPDDMKKKSGRPRKYVGKTAMTQEEKTQIALKSPENNFTGVCIVELDYYTMEYIDEYPSIKAYAADYGLSKSACASALNRNKCGIAYLHSHEKAFMRKEVFEKMKASIVKFDFVGGAHGEKGHTSKEDRS